mgnify:CR=1 FL=1
MSDADDASSQSSVSSSPDIDFVWLGKPQSSGAATGTVAEYVGCSLDGVAVSVGDIVLLRADGADEPYVCWVTRMWESDGQPLWRGRWFYRPGDFPSLAKSAQQHEVFLSGLVSFSRSRPIRQHASNRGQLPQQKVHNFIIQKDTNSAEAFAGLASVKFEVPNADGQTETIVVAPGVAPEMEVPEYTCSREYHPHGQAFKAISALDVRDTLQRLKSARAEARTAAAAGDVTVPSPETPGASHTTGTQGSPAASQTFDAAKLRASVANGPAAPRMTSPALADGSSGGRSLIGSASAARGAASPTGRMAGASAASLGTAGGVGDADATGGLASPATSSSGGGAAGNKSTIKVGPNCQADLPTYQGPRSSYTMPSVQPSVGTEAVPGLLPSSAALATPLGGELIDTAANQLTDEPQPELTPAQVDAFMVGFNKHGKKFTVISGDIAGASTTQVVQYYYAHKSARAVQARQRHIERHGALPEEDETLGGGEKRDVVPLELKCMRAAGCSNVVTMRQYNNHRVLYRARTQCNASWRNAVRNPFWLCLECFPAPANALRQGSYSYGGAEEDTGRSRKRRRAALLADAERMAREWQHGGRLSYAAEAMYEYAADGQVGDKSGGATGALGGVRAALMQAQLGVKDSVEFVHRVRQVYGASSKRFLRLLQLLFRYQRRALSVRGLAARVMRLFRRNPPILKAFAVFLPPGVREAYVRGMQYGLKLAGMEDAERVAALEGSPQQMIAAVGAGAAAEEGDAAAEQDTKLAADASIQSDVAEGAVKRARAEGAEDVAAAAATA